MTDYQEKEIVKIVEILKVLSDDERAILMANATALMARNEFEKSRIKKSEPAK